MVIHHIIIHTTSQCGDNYNENTGVIELVHDMRIWMNRGNKAIYTAASVAYGWAGAV